MEEDISDDSHPPALAMRSRVYLDVFGFGSISAHSFAISSDDEDDVVVVVVVVVTIIILYVTQFLFYIICRKIAFLFPLRIVRS